MHDDIGKTKGQIVDNEKTLLIQDDGGSKNVAVAGGESTLEVIALIAEIFVEDMLRLEREHGLDASEMLDYYKGNLALKETE